MPANDPEPENYSIDDMMDRLRTRGGTSANDGAELVTREDGTQVYRQRKRKRRSHQPKKEKENREKKFRMIQVVAAVTLVAGAGLALLGAVIYLNSSNYQEKITQRAAAWTGADPKFTQFRVSPVSAGAGSVELKWPAGSILDDLKLNGVRANLSITSLLVGRWTGAEMVAASGGELILSNPDVAIPINLDSSGECPFQFSFRSPKLNVLFGGKESPIATLYETEGSLTLLDPEATTTNLQFVNGSLAYKALGDFGLKLASFQFENGGVRVGNIRLSPTRGSRGEISIMNPQQIPLDLSGGSTVLPVRIEDADLSSLLGPNVGKWLRAIVESPEPDASLGSITYTSGASPEISCRIPFSATPLSETGFGSMSLFGIIAREISESSYQDLKYDVEASGVIVRNNEFSGLEDIRFQSRGRLIITGGFKVDQSGKIDGEINVGIPDASVNQSTAALRAVFKRRSEGHSWATIRLFGPASSPLDDLQKQLDSVGAIQMEPGGGASSAEDAFRELTDPGNR